MPAAWRVHVIRARLEVEGIDAEVLERDLYSLEGAEREAVLNAMLRQAAGPPMVLVGGTMACAGGVDMAAVVETALGRA